ncbi:hypothetical protein Tco_0134003 [Tanacetum coccineum]
MGRDTIQLEDVVSTISQEYLLEFSSEYFIPENLHPELPGPGDHIVDFPEGKIGVYTKKIEFANFRIPISQFLFDILGYYQIHLSQLSVIGAEAGVYWHPAAAKQEIPVTDDTGATEAAVEPNLKKEHPRGEVAGGYVDTELAIHVQETQEPSVATQSVSDPDPLSTVMLTTYFHCSVDADQEKGVTGNQDSEKSTPSPPITGSPGSIYQPGWGVPNSCRLDTPEACQDVVDHIAPPGYFSELRHLPNDEFLSQYNINLARQVAMGSQLRLRFEQEAKLLKKSVAQVTRRDQRIATREKHIKDLEAQLEAEINMKKAAEAKNSEVTKELEDLRMRFSGLEVGNAQLSQQVSVLQAQVMGEKRIMAAFEDFKKHEDERVNARCAEMDARLDALSVDFDEELYPHMLTAIAGRVEHGKAGLELTVVEAYDPEADNKYVTALHDLKDLNYLLIDELEQLKDAPLDVIMASLYLDSDTGEDAPQFIRDLRPSSSQLKIYVYPKKKKKSRVICRTHGVGSAHHARSDGIPVSVPNVAPQGLQILLADAATQNEDKESPRLLRSKSLPAMFNLDWP